MTLPMILAGPILRRVEPGLVSVWVALSKARSVQLSLFENFAKAGDTPKFSRPADTVDTVAVGDKLHIAVVMMKLTGADALKPGQLYSYNISLTDKATNLKEDLASLGLLKDDLLSSTPVEKRRLALGYEPDRLPSFSLPPDKLTDLKIIHGSCRIQVAGLTDGLAWVDDLIKDKFKDPNQRIHQLLLAGDQIYADDVELMLLPQMIALGQDLLAKRELLPTNEPNGLSAKFSPADEKNFPAGMRQNLVLSEARMTTVDNNSHAMSFGEFAAMYLYAWNNEIWQPAAFKDFDATIAEFQTNFKTRAPDTVLPLFRRRDDKNQPTILDVLLRRFIDLFFKDLTADELKAAIKENDGMETPERDPIDAATLELGKLPAPGSPARAKFPKVYTFADGLPKADLDKLRAFVEQLQEDLGGLYKKTLDTRRVDSTEAVKNLHMVRRALANVPTYMMWDDHDVTDDWNLNPAWRDRVMTSPLGRAIVRNGMLAFALFQGWGNDPEKYTQGKHKRLLELASQLYATASTPQAQQLANDEIELLFGLNRRAIDPAKFDDQLSWHYSVPGTRHLVVVLDNRSQRNWLSRGGPPTNITPEAIEKQIPAGPLPAGKDVLIVVAPLPVLGPPLFDELIAPLAYRAFDIIEYMKNGNENLRGMPGTNPDAIEAWAFDPRATQKLLERLEPYRKVVLLSGDVHFGSAQVLSFWKKADADSNPCRIVQFTSSGFKKVLPSYIRDVDLQISRAQRLIRAGLNAERLIWNAPGDLLSPEGKKAPAPLRARLKESPVLIPTFGWPAGTKANTPPDFAWRIQVLLDQRVDFEGPTYEPDKERPAVAKPIPAAPDVPARDPNGPDPDFKPTFAASYQRIVGRHALSFTIMRNGRQLNIGNNLGLIRFTIEKDPSTQNDVLHAIQELHAIFPYLPARHGESAPDRRQPGDPEEHLPFAVHKARLAGNAIEKRPKLPGDPS